MSTPDLQQTLVEACPKLSPYFCELDFGAKTYHTQILQSKSKWKAPDSSQSSVCEICGFCIEETAETSGKWIVDLASSSVKLEAVQRLCSKCSKLSRGEELLRAICRGSHTLEEKAELLLLSTHFNDTNGHEVPHGEDDLHFLRQCLSLSYCMWLQLRLLKKRYVLPNGRELTEASLADYLAKLEDASHDDVKGKNKKKHRLGRSASSAIKRKELKLAKRTRAPGSAAKKKKTKGSSKSATALA